MLYELYSGQPAWAGLPTGDIISAKLRTHASQALRMSADAPPALQVPYLSPKLLTWSVWLVFRGIASLCTRQQYFAGPMQFALSLLALRRRCPTLQQWCALRLLASQQSAVMLG